jgi:RNA polymerase sigma-70 factor (ECF subfamily)
MREGLSSSAGVPDSDDGLLAALGRGEPDAVARLYERHRPKMIAFAGRYVADRGTAEDVVAGLVQRWLERPPTVRESDRFVAFLATSVYHAAIDWVRRDRAQQGQPPRHDAGSVDDRRRKASIGQEALGTRPGSLQDQLRTALELMSDADRLLLEVHYGQALTPEECMSLLQITRPAFHQRLHRARTRLARLLAESDQTRARETAR